MVRPPFHLTPSGGRRLQIDRVLVSYFDTEVLQRLSPPNHRPSEYREYGSLAEVADKIRAALHGRSGDAVHRVLPAGGMVSVLHYFSATFARTKRAVHKLQRKAAVTPFMLLDGMVASWLRCHLVPTASRVCVCVCVFVYVRVSVCVAALLPYIVPIVVATLAGRRFRTLFGALPCVYACALETPHHRHCLPIGDCITQDGASLLPGLRPGLRERQPGHCIAAPAMLCQWNTSCGIATLSCCFCYACGCWRWRF